MQAGESLLYRVQAFAVSEEAQACSRAAVPSACTCARSMRSSVLLAICLDCLVEEGIVEISLFLVLRVKGVPAGQSNMLSDQLLRKMPAGHASVHVCRVCMHVNTHATCRTVKYTNRHLRSAHNQGKSRHNSLMFAVLPAWP